MKYILNLVIVGAIVFLAYALYMGIQEPIQFRAEKDKRKAAVVTKLEEIRELQEMHRLIRGEFAKSFDDLKSVLASDSIPFVKLLADPEDPENPDKFIQEITYSSAADSVNSMGIDMSTLQFVPYTNNGSEFTMTADTLTYQKTLVPVMECMTRWNVFMGPYADQRYTKYDDSYNPDRNIGFGSMSSPNLEGNWN